MIRFILTLLMALSLPIAAQGQSFPKPPDVATYVPVTPVWEAGSTVNVPVDPNVTPPPQAGLADIPSTITNQLDTGLDPNDGGFKLTTADGGSGTEAKFRTHANCTKVAATDPVRNFGQQNVSHLHAFFGNVQIDDWSTFAKLRTNRRSLAGGGDLNATGYWYPAIVKGAYALKCKYVVIYYKVLPSEGRTTVVIPNGLQYVSGADMDDPNKEWLRTHIAAANAQPGTTGRYFLANTLTGAQSNDFEWTCIATGPGNTGGESHKYLKNADGSDPWGGRCVAGDDMALKTLASNCWDGVNLWSPGGYKHVIQAIWDTQVSKFVCPKNYYRMAELDLAIWFEHDGFSDYGNWRLSSDDMWQAKWTAVGSPRTVLNGESAHFDWKGAWAAYAFGASTGWQKNCIGAQNGTPHECNDGRINGTEALKRGGTVTVFGSSQTRTPQVDLSSTAGFSSPNGRFPIPANPNGPATIHVHGN